MRKATPSYYENVIIRFIDPQIIQSFYDIGVGPKTEYLTVNKRFPQIDFFGLEANPEMFQTAKTKFPGVILPLAVSESGGNVEYVIHENNIMASGLIPYDKEADGEKFVVESITLDAFDSRFRSPDGVLLWMDIEGYELKALMGGKKLLESGRVKLLNIEVRPEWNGKSGGCTENEIDEFLSSYRYRKVFAYNHYPSSRHHDAVYCHEEYVLPPAAVCFCDLYNNLKKMSNSKHGILDLIYAAIDHEIAIDEHLDKISYLRHQLK